MQSDVTRWEHAPGSIDALKTEWLFESSNVWGIPDVPAAPLGVVPTWLAPYRTRIRARGEGVQGRGGTHFFLHDYRFEGVWNRPTKALESLAEWDVVLSPDFSVYREWPLTLQLWNVYRNRWCHAFWAYHGITVIPTVSWSTPESYPFAFAGVPPRSVVAVGTVGINWEQEGERFWFERGWQAMVETLKPVQVLVYGTLPDALQEQVRVHCYPPYWEGVVTLKRRQHHGR